MTLTLVIYDPDHDFLNRIRPHCAHLPYIELLNSDGPTAHRLGHLDALWATPMQAEYLGVSTNLREHEARVYRTPQQQIREGLPPHLVIGVLLSKSDVINPEFELALVISALVSGVSAFNATVKYPIRRIGFLPDQLNLKKLSAATAFAVIDKALTDLCIKNALD